jgi:hypothetical protein
MRNRVIDLKLWKKKKSVTTVGLIYNKTPSSTAGYLDRLAYSKE